ncbi:hypothetical protein JI739_03830 [Ramlibacter sp. AW1]|uniref:Uncharacterized protein n=1 Tax=Ramlibacter aurantiacus TaxID=2801330 RepID=A0A936ZEI8_9BURK|nr:hypothetical protein [Ramlibacter aurantiacus]MBL0419472.1 hypothetical protein [Ramlibacter aurantiacus]
MSLLKRLFGDKPAPPPPSVSRFEDSEESSTNSRSVPRREVVHVVLRDTMRRHGIPTEWIECRTLSLVQSSRSTGTYVTFIVRGGQDRLLAYVPAFQASFKQALERFDPRSTDWLRGVAWQFECDEPSGQVAMPDAAAWREGQGGAPVAATGIAAATTTLAAVAAEGDLGTAADDDDLASDLKALFAIRDAALSDRKSSEDDFKPTETGGL